MVAKQLTVARDARSFLRIISVQCCDFDGPVCLWNSNKRGLASGAHSDSLYCNLGQEPRVHAARLPRISRASGLSKGQALALVRSTVVRRARGIILPSTTPRIRTDHNEDETAAILQEWSRNVQSLYANVDFYSTSEVSYVTSNPFDMPDERYTLIAQLRQKALDTARTANVDYLLVSGLL